MFLPAQQTHGVYIEVYDANGQRIEDVIYCDTETGLVGSLYRLCPGIEREFYAPAPLKLINRETGVEIADELALAVCAAFKRARETDERKWEVLEEKQTKAFRELKYPFLARVCGVKPGTYVYDAFKEALKRQSDDCLDSSRFSVRFLD